MINVRLRSPDPVEGTATTPATPPPFVEVFESVTPCTPPPGDEVVVPVTLTVGVDVVVWVVDEEVVVEQSSSQPWVVVEDFEVVVEVFEDVVDVEVEPHSSSHSFEEVVELFDEVVDVEVEPHSSSHSFEEVVEVFEELVDVEVEPHSSSHSCEEVFEVVELEQDSSSSPQLLVPVEVLVSSPPCEHDSSQAWSELARAVQTVP